MQKSVQIRAVRSDDEKQLCEIIREAWNYHRYSEKKQIVDAIVHHIFLEYAMEQSYMRVAVQGGRILGLLMGRNEEAYSRRQVLRYLPKRMLLSVYLHGTREGRRYFKNSRIENQADRRLLQNCADDFDGELVLFAVRSEAQGKGIGRLLLQDFTQYMRICGAEDFFVLTDDFCNVDFYIRRGYKKIKAVPSKFRKSGKPAKFYLLKNSLL